MKRGRTLFVILAMMMASAGCSTAYKKQPVAFKMPGAHAYMANAAGAQLAAKAFDDPEEAKKAFGFDILGSGMLPVQVVIDNLGDHELEINGGQTFLEDKERNLWTVLSTRTAYERATKYSKTGQIAKEGAYKGLLGAAAGSIIGAAIGIVTGGDVGSAAGRGAAAGAATGAVIGGVGGYTSDDARRSITTDLQEKSLQNKPIGPKSLAHGILFFPAEASAARQLRLQLVEKDTGKVHVVQLELS
jgi:hypothetical protein